MKKYIIFGLLLMSFAASAVASEQLLNWDQTDPSDDFIQAFRFFNNSSVIPHHIHAAINAHQGVKRKIEEMESMESVDFRAIIRQMKNSDDNDEVVTVTRRVP